MAEIDLDKLEKDIDYYFDTLTEEALISDLKKAGIDILKEDGILDELVNGTNGHIYPIRPKKKRKGNKGFNNQSTRRRG